MYIEEALKKHLVADAGLLALVSTRIHAVTMPQNSALPAVVCSKVSSVPEYTHDGSAGAVESRFQLSCLAADYPGVKSLAKTVKKALRQFERAPGIMGGAGGLHVAGVFLESEFEMFDASDTDAQSRYHVPLDYLVLHAEDF